jgi:subtilase family serine protease
MNLFQRKDLYGVCVVLCAVSCLSSAPFAGAQSAPQARVMQSVRNDKLTTLRGNVHPMARVSNDRGELPGTQAITRMTLLLQRGAAQETALEQLLADQQDPKSPNYHAWLTPQQFGEQFGPADSDIQTLKGWLSSQGFSNLRITNGKTLITFDGTAGQVANAFHTGIHRLSVNGREHFANMQEPQIPEALAPVVAGIHGLNNFHPQPLVKRFGKFQRNRKTGEITPLFTFTDVNGTFFGVGPADFRTIYNVPSTLDGTGVSIAVVGQSNINLQDVADFRSIFGLSVNPPTVILNGPDPGLVSGDEGESDLDVEWAGAIAPSASIKFVTTQSTSTDGVSGVDASVTYIVDNNVAPILSESYGVCESGLGTAGNQFYQLLWQQAAAQGITVVVSAGDNGSAGCDDPNSVTSIPADGNSHLAVSGIASTPFNVAMGGTDFNQANQQTTYWNSSNGTGQVSAKGYIPEMVWNDSCAAAGATGCNSVTSSSASLNIVAGSGGPSAVYSKPPWQSSGITGMPSDGKRDLPDVSLFSADGNNKSFYIVCQSDADIAGDTGCNLTTFSTNSPFHDFQAVGGTSAAAPTFAGIMALINQKTGQRQGNANPSLYALGKNEAFGSCDSSQGNSGKSSSACVFSDITGNVSKDGLTPTLNNSVPCAGGATNCSKASSGGFGVLTSGGSPAFIAGVGYDLATGLGTPNVANLINAWAAISATGSTTATVTLSPATVTGTAGAVSGNLSGTVSGASGTPTGVVILENSATSGPLQSDGLSGGSYSVPAAMLPAGTYSVKAHYSGDTTYASKDSSPISVTLSKQNSTVLVSFVNAAGNLVTSSQSVAYGSNYILRVDVENAGGTPCQNGSGVTVFVCPSGTIALKDNGSALNDFPNAQNANASSSARLNDRGFAEDQPIQLNVGAHAITAAYTADAASSYNSNSSSNSLAVTITQATTSVAVTPNVTSVVSGGSITITATVNSQSNSAQGPTGTVQFKNGSTNLGAAATCTPKGADFSGATMVGALCTAQLTTTLSALPPGLFVEPQPRNTPFVIVTVVAAMLAMLSFVLALKLGARRRRFAYAGAVFALVTAAALAGCSGSSNSGGGGGGGGGGSSRTISAAYSGDTNYATSSGSTTVTVQ